MVSRLAVGTFVRGRRVMWQGELVTPSDRDQCGSWRR